jgi:hypothetical protein
MFTIATGIRITFKPSWPWRPRFKGWLSFFWFHFLLHVGFRRSRTQVEILIGPEESKMLEICKTLDNSKRKSLQPGPRKPPPGFADIDLDAIVEREAKIAKQATTATKSNPKHRVYQPGTRETEDRIIRDRLKDSAMYHKFFGSQLIVGDITVIRNLNNQLHKLEITAGGQLYIDNQPHVINPDDLMRVKQELGKQQHS